MTAPPACRLCDRARDLDEEGHCEGCATKPQWCACGAPMTWPRNERGATTSPTCSRTGYTPTAHTPTPFVPAPAALAPCSGCGEVKALADGRCLSCRLTEPQKEAA